MGFDLLRSKERCQSENGDVKYINQIAQTSDYPDLTKLIAAPGCTLIEKVFYLANKHRPGLSKLTFLSLLLTYAMLRYYIWYQLNGCYFDISILYRKNFHMFAKAVRSSNYAPYEEVFKNTAIEGYGKYFKCSGRKHES